MWRKPFLLCAKRSFESWKWYATPAMGDSLKYLNVIKACVISYVAQPFFVMCKRSFESWKWYVTLSIGCLLFETVAMEIAFYVYFHWLQ